MICPVARGCEEDEEEERTVDAWSVEEVGADKEEEYENRGGVRGYEEEGKPATGYISISASTHSLY
jgi:hypothetical protein